MDVLSILDSRVLNGVLNGIGNGVLVRWRMTVRIEAVRNMRSRKYVKDGTDKPNSRDQFLFV